MTSSFGGIGEAFGHERGLADTKLRNRPRSGSEVQRLAQKRYQDLVLETVNEANSGEVAPSPAQQRRELPGFIADFERGYFKVWEGWDSQP